MGVPALRVCEKILCLREGNFCAETPLVSLLNKAATLYVCCPSLLPFYGLMGTIGDMVGLRSVWGPLPEIWQAPYQGRWYPGHRR